MLFLPFLVFASMCLTNAIYWASPALAIFMIVAVSFFVFAEIFYQAQLLPEFMMKMVDGFREKPKSKETLLQIAAPRTVQQQPKIEPVVSDEKISVSEPADLMHSVLSEPAEDDLVNTKIVELENEFGIVIFVEEGLDLSVRDIRLVREKVSGSVALFSEFHVMSRAGKLVVEGE